MRADHKMSWWERSAFTRWRRVERFRSGERKRLKRLSHHKDRQKAKREIGVCLRGDR